MHRTPPCHVPGGLGGKFATAIYCIIFSLLSSFLSFGVWGLSSVGVSPSLTMETHSCLNVVLITEVFTTRTLLCSCSRLPRAWKLINVIMSCIVNSMNASKFTATPSWFLCKVDFASSSPPQETFFFLVQSKCNSVASGDVLQGDFSASGGWLYLSFAVNLSVCYAFYCLGMFYYVLKAPLKPYDPVPKFLCIKAVLFLSFWQVRGEHDYRYLAHGPAYCRLAGVYCLVSIAL